MSTSADDGWFDAARFERERQRVGTPWGAPCEAPALTASTNDLALAAARGEQPEGAVFVAREQTQGRGRRGNVWSAPAGENLTFSVLTRPERPLPFVAPLPLIVGLAVRAVVARALPQAGAERAAVTVKWPNDVLVGRRKIAGVLVESRLRGAQVAAAVIGVGLNVATLSFPEAVAPIATSLAREGAAPSALEPLLASLLLELSTRYERFLDAGLESFLPELEIADGLRGERVAIEGVTGTAAGITPQGALRLLEDGGVLRHVSAGHVQRLNPDGR